MNTMTSFSKVLPSSSHIAMEMLLHEEDKILIAEDDFDVKAKKAFDEMVERNLSGQGIDVNAIDPRLLPDSVHHTFKYDVIMDWEGDWGVDLFSMKGEVMSIDLPNMTCYPLSFFLERNMDDISCAGDVVLLNVKAGSVFAVRVDSDIKVYASTGAVVGDKSLEVLELSKETLGTKFDYIKDKFDEQAERIAKLHDLDFDYY
tara:strand:+ start:117 stop:722 length:606 start_codon:yes stop_codon:yes gene_type:complete